MRGVETQEQLELLAAEDSVDEVQGYLLGRPWPYPLLAKPICLMTLDFPAAADDLYRRYPFFYSTVAERRQLFERSSAGELINGTGVSGVAASQQSAAGGERRLTEMVSRS